LLDARKLYFLIGVLGTGYIVTMVFGLFEVFQLLLFFVGLLSGIYVMFYHGFEQGYEKGYKDGVIQVCSRGSGKTE
jgi:hypothetical protein